MPYNACSGLKSSELKSTLYDSILGSFRLVDGSRRNRAASVWGSFSISVIPVVLDTAEGGGSSSSTTKLPGMPRVGESSTTMLFVSSGEAGEGSLKNEVLICRACGEV